MNPMFETFIEDHLNEDWNVSYEYSTSNPHYSIYQNFIRDFFLGNNGDHEVEVEEFFSFHHKKYIKAYVNIGLLEFAEDDPLPKPMVDNSYAIENLTAFKKEAVHQFLLYSEGKLVVGYKRQDPILSKDTWKFLKSDQKFVDYVYAKGKVIVDSYKKGTTKLKAMIEKLDMEEIDDLYEYSSRVYQHDSTVFKTIAWRFLFQLHTESLGVITQFITEDFAVCCCPFKKMHLVKLAGLDLSKSLTGEKRMFFSLSIRDDRHIRMKICDIQALDNTMVLSPWNNEGKIDIVKINRKRKTPQN